MARFSFRHGLARRQEDGVGNPTYLQKNGNYIDLIVSPDPTVFLIAHFDEDYMLTENVSVSEAWGPFTAGITTWLYWDIDFQSGEISRDYTLLPPVDNPSPPPTPATDQHWFDMVNSVMKVWNGASWVEKLRVFAAEYSNAAVLVHQPIGSQVGLNNVVTYAGAPLFDNEDKPLQKFRRDRRGKFITTETPLNAQFSRNANFRTEAAIIQAKAIENIPSHYCVAYSGYNEIKLAKNTAFEEPCIGIAAEDMVIDETRTFITRGYVQNDISWDWSAFDVGTPLFVGPTGELVTDPPQNWSLQLVATVVDEHTIFVNIQHQITYA